MEEKFTGKYRQYTILTGILILAASILACNFATHVFYYPEEPKTDATAPPVIETSRPDDFQSEVPYSNTDEQCFEGETYHPGEALCFAESDSFFPEFFRRMQQDIDQQLDNPSDLMLDEEEILVTYQIQDNQILYPQKQVVSHNLIAIQNDETRHQELWRYFAAIIPPDARQDLVEFDIMTDGPAEMLAAVEQTIDDPTQWALAIDPIDTHDFGDLTLTLVHEYGHLLTLNADQISPNLDVFNNPGDYDLFDQAAAGCPTYFPGEGCATKDAYLYKYVQRFWLGIYNEWDELNYIMDDTEYYNALDNFYFKYQDQFINDYAASNPEEDIAESWAYFVLTPQPAGNSIFEQKVLFFYEFPELVSLRQEIIARIYSRMIRTEQP